MTKEKIDITDLRQFVEGAFERDNELIEFFDRSANVSTVEEAIENVMGKIDKDYHFAEMVGIKDGVEKVGYFVYSEDLLISFGLNKKYRNKNNLSEFWEVIKGEIGETFQCVLFSYNERAIGWLRKSGMKVLFDSVTILKL